jgi:single-strand DNA-binding protein
MPINRVVLIGNLTRDPELRSMPSGKNVCHLRLACNRVRRDETGNWQDRPGFFDVSVFGPQAENVQRFCKKGRAIGVDGHLEWREWETPDQHKRQAVSIVAHTIEFLGRPPEPRPAATPGGEGEVAEAGSTDDGETPEAAGTEAATEAEAAPAGDALVF